MAADHYTARESAPYRSRIWEGGTGPARASQKHALTDRSGRFRFLALFLATVLGQGKRGGAAALNRLRLALRLRLHVLGLAGILRILGGLLGLILGLLRRGRRHDAVIMLRMLKIILRHDAVAAGIGVAGELQILLVNMAGRAANFDFRPGGVVSPVGVEAAAIIAAAAAAASA